MDEAEQDELGQPRTDGPLPTLDAARQHAAERRDRPPEASPLAARIAEAAQRPAGRQPAEPRASRAATKVGAAAPEVAAAPPRTWLEDLADRDPSRATEATRLIASLEREGDDRARADAAVRREVESGEPAVAQHRLARAATRAIKRASDPVVLAGIAASLPASDPQAAAAALARAVAMETLAALAAEVDGGGRAPGLPGWDLVERPAGTTEERRRRVRLTPAAE